MAWRSSATLSGESSSFQIRGRIFATVPPGDERLHVLVDEDEARPSAAEEPATFEELRWGKRLVGVSVNLAKADRAHVWELLEEAWRARRRSGLARRVRRRALERLRQIQRWMSARMFPSVSFSQASPRCRRPRGWPRWPGSSPRTRSRRRTAVWSRPDRGPLPALLDGESEVPS